MIKTSITIIIFGVIFWNLRKINIKKRKTFFFWIAFILLQMMVFSDHISPFKWGELKVTSLACTCPNLEINAGEIYLRTITPDSLKSEKINYSEIYLTDDSFGKFKNHNKAASIFDPSVITGKVVGKRQMDGEKTWNLVFQVETWREIDILKDLLIKVIFIFECLVFLILFSKNISENKIN